MKTTWKIATSSIIRREFLQNPIFHLREVSKAFVFEQNNNNTYIVQYNNTAMSGSK